MSLYNYSMESAFCQAESSYKTGIKSGALLSTESWSNNRCAKKIVLPRLSLYNKGNCMQRLLLSGRRLFFFQKKDCKLIKYREEQL